MQAQALLSVLVEDIISGTVNSVDGITERLNIINPIIEKDSMKITPLILLKEISTSLAQIFLMQFAQTNNSLILELSKKTMEEISKEDSDIDLLFNYLSLLGLEIRSHKAQSLMSS